MLLSMEARARHPVPVRFEDAAQLDPDEASGEIDRGKWVPVTRGTWRHGKIVARITARLWAWAERVEGFSVAAGDPGTKLSRAPDVLRGPDIGVVRSERDPTGTGVDGWLEGAPDVAVEVLGDTQTVGEMIDKALEYLGAGAHRVWLVDPDARAHPGSRHGTYTLEHTGFGSSIRMRGESSS
jgi:Uma2 family endonuclease